MPIGDIEKALKAQQIANINYNKFKANKELNRPKVADVETPALESNTKATEEESNNTFIPKIDNTYKPDIRNKQNLDSDAAVNISNRSNIVNSKEDVGNLVEKSKKAKKLDEDFENYQKLFNRDNDAADTAQQTIQQIAEETSPVYKKFKASALYGLDKDEWTKLAAKYQSVLENSGEKAAISTLNADLENIASQRQTPLENFCNGLNQFGSTFTGATIEALGMLYGLGKVATFNVNQSEGNSGIVRAIDTVLDNEVTRFANDLSQYGLDLGDISHSFEKARELGLPNFYNAKPSGFNDDVIGTVADVGKHPAIMLSELLGQSGFTANAIVGSAAMSATGKVLTKGIAGIATRGLNKEIAKQGISDVAKLKAMTKMHSRLKTIAKTSNLTQAIAQPTLLAMNEAGIEGLSTKMNIIEKGTQEIDNLRAEQVKNDVNKIIENNYNKVMVPTTEGDGEVMLVDKKTGERHSLIDVYKKVYNESNAKYYDDMEKQLHSVATTAGMQNFFMNTAFLSVTNGTLQKGLLDPNVQRLLSINRVSRATNRVLNKVTKGRLGNTNKVNLIRDASGKYKVDAPKVSKLQVLTNYIKEPLGEMLEESGQNVTDNAAEAAAMYNLEEFIHRKYNGDTSLAIGQTFGDEAAAFAKGFGEALTDKETYIQGVYGALSSIMGTPFLARRGRNAKGEKVWFRGAVDENGNKESAWSIIKRMTPWRSGLAGTKEELKHKISLTAQKSKALEDWINDNPDNEKKILGAIGLNSWESAMGDAAESSDEFAYRNSRLGKTVQTALYLDQLKGTDFYDTYMNIYQKAANMEEGDDNYNSIVSLVRQNDPEGTKGMSDKEIADNVKKNAAKILDTMNQAQQESEEIDRIAGNVDTDTKQSLIYSKLASTDMKSRIESLDKEIEALHLNSSSSSSLSEEAKAILVRYGSTKEAEEELNSLDKTIKEIEQLIEDTEKRTDVDKGSKKRTIKEYKKTIKELNNSRKTLSKSIEDTREELKDNPVLTESDVMSLNSKLRGEMLIKGKAKQYAARHGNLDAINAEKQRLTNEIQELEDKKASYIKDGKPKKGHNKQVESINKEIESKTKELNAVSNLVKNYYSQEQQKVLDNLLLQAEQQDKGAFDKIIDRGKLQQRLEDYYSNYNEILENPDGFSYKSANIKYMNSKFLAKERAASISNIQDYKEYAKALDDVMQHGTAVERQVIPSEIAKIAKERGDDENSNYGKYKKTYSFIKDFVNRLDNGTFLDGGSNWQRNVLGYALSYLRDNQVDFTDINAVRKALLEREGDEENSIFKIQSYIEEKEKDLKEIDKTPFSSDDNSIADLLTTYESALNKYQSEKKDLEEATKEREVKETPDKPNLVETKPEPAKPIIKDNTEEDEGTTQLKSRSKALHKIVDSIKNLVDTKFLNNLTKGLNTLNPSADKSAINTIQKLLDSGNVINEQTFIDALKEAIAKKSETKQVEALKRVLQAIENRPKEADLTQATKTDAVDIEALRRENPDHPIVKFYETMGIYNAVKSSKLDSTTPVYFIHSSQLTQSVRDYSGEAFTNDDIPVITAVESESGPIEINGKKYQPIGVMPSTNSYHSGSANLGYVRDRINTRADGYSIITNNGNPIKTTLYGKPTAAPADNNYRGRNTASDVILNNPALSSEDKAEIDKNNHGARFKNLKNPRWRELATNFIHSLRRVKKNGRNTLVYAQNRLNGTFGESEIFVKDIADSTNPNGDTVLDVINRGRNDAEIAKDLMYFNDTFNSYFYGIRNELQKLAGQEDIDNEYLKIVSKNLENILHYAFNISEANNAKYNIVATIDNGAISFSIVNTSYDNNSNSYVTNETPIITISKESCSEEAVGNTIAYNVFKKLFLNDKGEVAKNESGYPLVKYQVNYNLIDNLSNEEKRGAIEEYYMKKLNDGILQIAATQLDHSFRFVSINSPNQSEKPKPKAVITNNDNADSAKPTVEEKQEQKPTSTKESKNKVTEAQQNALKILDKAVEQGARFTASEDGRSYSDKDTGKPYLRVTTAKYSVDEIERFDPNNPYSTVSHYIGNTVDSFLRDLFDDYDAGKPYTGSKNALKDKNYKDSYKGVSEQSLRNTENTIRTKIIDRLKKDGWIFYSKGITCSGVITMLDANGNERAVKVAGTIDLIAVDKNGNFHLFDFKTTHKNKNSADKGYQIQMYLYKQLLSNMGINVVDVNLIAIKTNYPNPTKNKGYTEKDGILYYGDTPYVDNVQPNIPLIIKVPFDNRPPVFKLSNLNAEEIGILEQQVLLNAEDNPTINIEAEDRGEDVPFDIIDYDNSEDLIISNESDDLGVEDYLDNKESVKKTITQEEWDNMSEEEKKRNKRCIL